MPSLAKLIPSAGSGSSGGTSSAGKVTSQDSPGCPYKHKFSLSRTTNQNKKQYNKYIQKTLINLCLDKTITTIYLAHTFYLVAQS
jgi:ribosomal protein S30